MRRNEFISIANCRRKRLTISFGSENTKKNLFFDAKNDRNTNAQDAKRVGPIGSGAWFCATNKLWKMSATATATEPISVSLNQEKEHKMKKKTLLCVQLHEK